MLIHGIQVLIYRGSTNERLSGEGVAYDSYYNETDRVIHNFDKQCGEVLEVNKIREVRRGLKERFLELHEKAQK